MSSPYFASILSEYQTITALSAAFDAFVDGLEPVIAGLLGIEPDVHLEKAPNKAAIVLTLPLALDPARPAQFLPWPLLRLPLFVERLKDEVTIDAGDFFHGRMAFSASVGAEQAAPTLDALFATVLEKFKQEDPAFMAAFVHEGGHQHGGHAH